MKTRLIPTLILVAVLLAGCSALASQTQAPPEEVIPEPDVTFLPAPTPTQTLLSTALPIATSRGPELEATDPTTVTLASGGLQFVEFFEFW